MSKINNINRRKFLGYFGCCACGIIIPACTTVPITERRQLSIFPEARINKQAAQLYEKVKLKTKLSTDKNQLNEIKEIGSKIEEAVSSYFASINQKDPTYNFQWEYILVDNDKVKNAWCMPGGKIAIYTGILEITKNTIPLKRIADPIEIAHPIVFMLSSKSSFITAASLIVDGGKTGDLNAGN